MIAGSRIPPLVFSLWLVGLLVGMSTALADNRLAGSTSDYLRDHVDNPVDWYPWGEKALARARREDKPLFVSVGYSTCYWCHVAERELYQDPQIAAKMNADFVNIKIDREQRPDIDRALMQATEVLTGGGGWPNNVFLTPELQPFFAGSYFPPEDMPGRESFPAILERIATEWREDRGEILATAEEATAQLRERAGDEGMAPERIDPERWRAQAIEALRGEYDALVGGFAPAGQSSRFPQSPRLALLLAASGTGNETSGAPVSGEMLEQTLAAMSIGALFDHVGGGFHRYTVDPEWTIPHFEKMLVDNAQLLGIYAMAAEQRGQPWFAHVARRTAEYMLGHLAADEGGLYTAEDAAVDGIEGKSYVFTRAEVESVLDERAGPFFDLYELIALPESRVDHELPDGGVLNLRPGVALGHQAEDELADTVADFRPALAALRDYREQREQPRRDRKRIAEFNALAILGLSQAAQRQDRGVWNEAAVALGEWLWRDLWQAEEQRLARQRYKGVASGEGFLSDYAAAGRAMLALYGSQHDYRWLFRAQRLAEAIRSRFVDQQGRIHERPASMREQAALPVTPPLVGDEVAPAGVSHAVVFLLDLGALLDNRPMQERAVRGLAVVAGEVDAAPADWGFLVAELSRPARAEVVREVAASLAAEASTSGGPGASRDHVAVEAELVEGGAAIAVRLAIEPGFHVNANPASEDYLVPTRITAADGALEAIEYPEGHPFRAGFAGSAIDVYTGELIIRVPVVRGRAPSRLKIDLQACNDAVCLPPDQVEVPVTGR